MRIVLLPEEVRSKIAAGEVIEGPAECVKELIENSLDAKASRIEVEIFKGGKRYIGVKDNGEGIFSEDLEKAILRGATSKIKTIDDLLRLSTYGYRGEALYAIASVSRLTIRSRHYQEEVGKEIRVEGGRLISHRQVGMPVGTHVEVFDLFYNLPARKAFLKREDTERRRIYKVFKLLALANPSVHFKLLSDGREVFNLKPTVGYKDRAEEIFESKMEALTYSDEHVKVQLLVSITKNNKESYLFVNKRPVFIGSLSEYIKKLSGGGSLICLVEVPQHLLDVNVHPKKHEVHIKIENRLREIILELLNRRHKPMPVYNLRQETFAYEYEPEFIGIIDNTVILAKYGDYIYFFDQHLLSESYNHQVLRKEPEEACKNSVKAGQKLSTKEAKELLRAWLKLENKETCPHGRPIYYRIHISEILSKLGRRL